MIENAVTEMKRRSKQNRKSYVISFNNYGLKKEYDKQQ